MRTRHVFQKTLIFCGLAILLVCGGCSSDGPPEELLRNFLEKEMREPVAKIASISPEWIKNGETAYEGKVPVTLEFIQPLFESGTLDEALAKAGEKSAESAMLRYALDQAKTLPEPLRGSMLEQAPKNPLFSREFIKETVAVKSKVTITLMIRSNKTADGWTFDVTSSLPGSTPKEFSGRERSRFSENALVVGTDETKKTIQVLIAETRQFAKDVEKAKVDILKAQEEALAVKSKAITSLLQPGTIFWGIIERDAGAVQRMGFIVQTPDATGLIYPITVLIPDTFHDLPPERLLLRTDPQNQHLLLLTIGETSAALDILNGKLTGPLQGASGNASFAPITEKQLEHEKQQSAQRIAEMKAQEEKNAAKAIEEKRYADSLTKALVPNSGYQGTWKHRNRTGSIGIAIMDVTANGLGAQGFIFDPLAPEKRKPFTAVINRDLKIGRASCRERV